MKAILPTSDETGCELKVTEHILSNANEPTTVTLPIADDSWREIILDCKKDQKIVIKQPPLPEVMEWKAKYEEVKGMLLRILHRSGTTGFIDSFYIDNEITKWYSEQQKEKKDESHS